MLSAYAFPRSLFITLSCFAGRVHPFLHQGYAFGYWHTLGIHRPRIVTVPLRPGLRSYRSLDDLLVRVYVARWNRSGMNSNSIGRCHITRFPSDSRRAVSLIMRLIVRPLVSVHCLESLRRRDLAKSRRLLRIDGE
ncbi:MAG: hypothetical protein NXY57DRAFT_1003734 [Lentinula lateritia]|nr:MAG: hypothetical protein NXY57DRAFT_1003734 [Lentinula lateritia]